MTAIFYMTWTSIILIDLFRTVDLQYGVYGPPPMFPPPIYPPPPPILPMAAPMPAPMPMMSPFLIPIEKSSSEEGRRKKTTTTVRTTTKKKSKKKEYALAFPMPMPMPCNFMKPKLSSKQKELKPRKAFAIPMPMMPPPPVVAPPPVILAPFPPPIPRPRGPRRMRPRQRWYTDSSFSSESTDMSSCESSHRRHRRYRQRRGQNIYKSNNRRKLRSLESNHELVKPMLSYIADNGDVKFETKINDDDVAELLGEKELIDKRSESVQVLTRGAANKPQIVVVSNKDGAQNRQGRVKEVILKGGVSKHVLREGKKELIFSAPENKKISNLSLSFQIN